MLASAALAFGLYTSVSGIDLSTLGKYRKVAALVILFGVPVKILLIGAVMYLIQPSVISFLIAVTVAQIDPLSVATLLDNKARMSKSAKTLLNVWASFDDPITVLVGFSVLLPLLTNSQGASVGNYLLGLIVNIFPAIVVYLVQRYLKPGKFIEVALLILGLVWAVISGSFLFAAILGLFLRPLPTQKLSQLVNIIYCCVTIAVGMSLNFYTLDLRIGVLLAIVTFFIVQPLVTVISVKGTLHDVFRLSYAQQNGITAIIMALSFQVQGFDIIGIILPAVVAINLFNLALNALHTYKETRGHISK